MSKILIITLAVLPILLGIFTTSVFTGESVSRVLGLGIIGLPRLQIAMSFLAITTPAILASYLILIAITIASLDKINELITVNKLKKIKISDFAPQSAIGLILAYFILVFCMRG